jgi:hypothetical protein
MTLYFNFHIPNYPTSTMTTSLPPIVRFVVKAPPPQPGGTMGLERNREVAIEPSWKQRLYEHVNEYERSTSEPSRLTIDIGQRLRRGECIHRLMDNIRACT